MKKWYVITGILVVLLVLTISKWHSNSTEVDRLVAESAKTTVELSQTRMDLADMRMKLGEAKDRVEIINSCLLPGLKGVDPGVDYFSVWMTQVEGVGDPILTSRFNMMLGTRTKEATEQFFIYLLESTAEVLE